MTILLSACDRDSLNGNENIQPFADMVRIGIFTNSDEFQKPASKGAQEDVILGTMPWVFVFDGNDGNAQLVEVGQAQLGLSGNSHVMLTQRATPVQVLIVANAPSQYFIYSTTYDFNKTNLETHLGISLTNFKGNLRTAIAAPETIPYDGGYLPLVGEKALENITLNTTIGTPEAKLNLTRMVAKVTVENTDPEFTIQSWSISHAKDATLFYSSTPSGINMDFVPDIAAAEDTFYIYPSVASESPSVIINGTYKGVPNQYYRLIFKDSSGLPIAIARNTWYKFIISRVDRPGFSTFNEAANSIPIAVTIEVIDYNSHEIDNNGRFYIGTSNSQVLFYGLPSFLYPVVTISTNAKSSNLSLNDKNTIKVIPDGALTLSTQSVVLSSDGITPGVTELKCNINAGFTEAKIMIQLGDLNKVIDLKKISENISQQEAATLLTSASSQFTTLEVADSYKNSWLFASPNGSSSSKYTNYTPKTPFSSVYLYLLSNNSGVDRFGEVFLSRETEGRVKVFVRQSF